MIAAKYIFTVAGLYGLVVLAPLYFLEGRIGQGSPPAITHPEFYYGFIGVALAWQVVFLLIGREAVRFRPLMLPSILEKLSYGVAVILLFVQGRVSGSTLVTGGIDLVLGALFALAFVWTPSAPRTAQ